MHLDDVRPPGSRDCPKPRGERGALAVDDPRRQAAEKPKCEMGPRPSRNVSRACSGKENLLDQRAPLGDERVYRLLVFRAKAHDPDFVAIDQPRQELGRRLRTVTQVQPRRDRRTNQEPVRTDALLRFGRDYESFAVLSAAFSAASGPRSSS